MSAARSWAPSYPIRTARLTLRPHLASDLDDLVIYHSDPEVTRYIPWPVRTREQTREALAMRLGAGSADAEGDWLILAIEHESRVIGEVLLKRVDDAEGAGELGYAIATDMQGRGLASEAARAMLDLAFGEFALRRVVAQIDEPNLASRRMIVRLGFTEYDRTNPDPLRGQSETLVHYSLERGAGSH